MNAAELATLRTMTYRFHQQVTKKDNTTPCQITRWLKYRLGLSQFADHPIKAAENEDALDVINALLKEHIESRTGKDGSDGLPTRPAFYASDNALLLCNGDGTWTRLKLCEENRDLSDEQAAKLYAEAKAAYLQQMDESW